MKLSKKAITEINETPIRLKLALRTGVTERWIQDCIRINKDDGFLTKAAALKLIREETGLTDDDILTKDEPITI